MKLKKIFALTLSVLMALGSVVPVFAYSDSVLTGSYVTAGENAITDADPDTVSIYYFTASSEEELGTYKVTTDAPAAKLRSYCGTVGFRYDNTKDTDYDPESNSYTFTATSVGAKYLIGVTGAESFNLNIEKVSDYKIHPVVKKEYGYSQHYDYKKCNLIISEDATRTYVDITKPQTVVTDRWGKKHLGTIDGPILYIDLKNTPYINLYEMALNGRLRYYTLTSSGDYSSKYDDSEMFLEYEFYADPKTGIYPLDSHLFGILKEVGEANGWYDKDRELGYYLFGDMEVDEESAYLFPCFYFEDPSLVKYATGYDYSPYALVCDNHNGNFCEINGTRYSDHSDFFSLDVYENSEVSCMAISPTLSTYKAFNIKYGTNTYKPDKEGLITFATDGKTDILEVVNTGTTDDVIFILMLTSLPVIKENPEDDYEYIGDGSPEMPYLSSYKKPKSINHMLAPGEFICVMTDTTYNASARICAFAPDGGFATDYLVYYGDEVITPKNNIGLISFELDFKDNYYLIYNYSDETLNIVADLAKTSPALPDTDGSAEIPHVLMCDPVDFSSYTIEKGESLNFRTNNSDGTYVIATATDAFYEPSTEIYLKYNGRTEQYPDTSGIIICRLTSESDTFEIVNQSGHELDLEVVVLSDTAYLTPIGSYENPFVIDIGEHTSDITEDLQGYAFYSYTATKDSILNFEIAPSQSEGWVYAITNTTTGFSTSHVFSGSGENAANIAVMEGETVLIGVGTYDGMRFWTIPEGEVTWSIEASDPIIGDINFDGEINAKDSNLLKRMIAGEGTVKEGTILFLCSNTNRDGGVSAKDSNILMQYLAGTLNKF